jgi:FKBP-type peptidyl-prolyl cis-trans isomerase
MKMRLVLGSLLVLMAVPVLAACAGDDDDDDVTSTVVRTVTQNASPEGSPTKAGPKLENSTVTASGLEYRDEVVGTGASPKMTDQVTVHYTGKLASNGKVFDSSVQRGQPATFAMNRVIKGFSEGLSTMKVGGKRTVYIPSDLGYGPAGNPPVIPPNADLIFEIELIAIK